VVVDLRQCPLGGPIPLNVVLQFEVELLGIAKP